MNRVLNYFLFAILGLLFALGIPALSAPPTPVSSEPSALIQQGKNNYQAGQFAEAVAVLQQAADTYQLEGKPLNRSLALNYLSLAYQELGEWEKAQTAIDISLSLLPETENSDETTQIRAQVLSTQGQLQLALGQGENALDIWKEAATLYDRIGYEPGKIGTQINQAQALESLGLYRRSCKTVLQAFEIGDLNCEAIADETTFDRVLAAFEKQPESLQGEGLRILGNTFRLTGKLTESQAVLERSLALAKTPQSESAAYLSLGNTARVIADRNRPKTARKPTIDPWRCQSETDNPEAISYYQKAAVSPSPLIRIQAQLNGWEIQPDASLLTEIQSQLSQLTPSRSSIFATVKYARHLMCSQPEITGLPDAVTELDRAISQAKAIEDKRAESYALGILGQVYESRQEWDFAKTHTQQALSLAQALPAPEIAYQWQWQLGRILKQQQVEEKAIVAYAEAVETLKTLRTDLVALNPDIQYDFRDEVEPVYRQFAELLFHTPNEKNLEDARLTIEALQLAELDNFFREACLQAEPQQIDRIDKKAAVLYTIILNNKLEIILSSPNQQISHYTTTLPDNFENKVVELTENIKDNNKNGYLLLSQQVYQWLFPLELEAKLTELAEKQSLETLVFVLDGVLRSVPIAALHDGEKFFIEKDYAVAFTPGLQLIDPKPFGQVQQRAVLAGISENAPSYRTVDPGNWRVLPNVSGELTELEQSIDRHRVFRNDRFTRETLQTELDLEPSEIVHIATHGQFGSTLEDTFILDWVDRLNIPQLNRLLQSQDTGKKETIELLVLSACETAAGDDRAALGLAGVAVRSGARSTLATLWTVNDRSTAEFMRQFYERLMKNQETKAESLRQVQQSFLADETYQNPIYWAPFVLVGNWL
ncbi:MAG: CHAT domain-containing protein [Geitlerinemataceae cyanobacterium]